MSFINSFETYNTLLAMATGAILVASWVILKVRLSSSPAYKEVRLARNILSIDYFLIAVFNIARITTTQNDEVDATITIIVGMYQVLLITSSLTTLVNPAKSSWGWVIWQSTAITALLGSYLAALFTDFMGTALIQNLVLALYIIQLVGYTGYFFHIYRYTLARIKDYFDEDEESRIVWVKDRYLGLLLMGIIAIGAPLNSFWFNSSFVIIYGFVYSYTAIGFVSNYYNYSSMIPTVMKITNEEKEIMEQRHKEELTVETVKEKALPTHFEQLEKALNKWVKEQGFLVPNIPMDEILKILNTTRPTLRTYMKQTYGMDFSTWRNSLRLEHAHTLLIEHPEHTIETIAELVGYSDTGNFARAFKLKYGVTPKTLLKQ